MVEEVNHIYIGVTSMRTCLGDKVQTFREISRGQTGLSYSDDYSMYVGVSDVRMYDDCTRFESLMIEQIEKVILQSGLPINQDVQLVISTTKGNVSLLADDCENIPERAYLYKSAEVIAKHVGFQNQPIVVSNACISGVSAFIVAKDLLQSGKYRHVIVAGGDVLSEFITAGFASFKSISPNPCRPYDAERDGLSLGEAAGAVLLTINKEYADEAQLRLSGGSVTNDANHISGPSRTGDGLYYAICNAMLEAGVEAEDVGFINAHGTATRYNDEMESKAMAWAGLNNKPLNSFKGYIGHTLGASGVVETILCIEQLKLGYIFGTAGFVSSDTPHLLNVSAKQQTIENSCCVKTASGFGGCNAAIVLCMGFREQYAHIVKREAEIVAEYTLPQSEIPFAEFIRSEFKAFGQSNMKFYKMSNMSKALYVAVENLLTQASMDDIEPTRRAIILANKVSSLDADVEHQLILNQKLAEGASPAAFVYTLANVAAGEMCIRHKIQGDNTFFIEDKNVGFVEEYSRRIVENNRADAVIYGWCDYLKGNWNVSIKLLKVK